MLLFGNRGGWMGVCWFWRWRGGMLGQISPFSVIISFRNQLLHLFRSWYLSSNRVQSVKVMCSHLASIPSLCWCWWWCRWCWWFPRVCIMMVMMILCGRRLAGWRKPNLFCLVATRFWSWTSWLPTCYSWTWLFRSPPEYICIYIWISVIIISAPR